MIRKILQVFVNFFLSSLFILFLSLIVSGSTLAVTVFGFALSDVLTLIVLVLVVAFLLFIGACGQLHIYDRIQKEIMVQDGLDESQSEIEAGFVVIIVSLFSLMALFSLPLLVVRLFFS